MSDRTPPNPVPATEPALRLLRCLYGEEKEHDDPHALLEKDEGLRAEYETFRTVKAHLDARPRSQPRPEVVDRIVATAAQQAARPQPPRADRAPVARRGTRRRVAGVAGALLVALLAFAVGVWQPFALSGSSAEQQAPPPAVASAEESPSPATLAWDEEEEVRRLYRRIELLEARTLGTPAAERPLPSEQSAYGWGVPLEALTHSASSTAAEGEGR